MKSIDYGWVIALVAIVILVVMWKPLTGAIGGFRDKASNKEGEERGKAIYYNAEYWLGPGSYKSCAMCHAPDFVPDPAKKVDMVDYVPGKPQPLVAVKDRYDSGTLNTGDELYEQINKCITLPSRIGGGKVSSEHGPLKDLMLYVSRL
jgi:hypothetical protein